MLHRLLYVKLDVGKNLEENAVRKYFLSVRKYFLSSSCILHHRHPTSCCTVWREISSGTIFIPFVNWRKRIIQMTMFIFDALLVGLPVAPYGEKLVPAHFLPVEHFLSFKHFLSLKHFLSSPFNSFSWDSYQGDSDAHFFCLWCAQLGFPVFDPASMLSLPFIRFCGGKWWMVIQVTMFN